ncbi:nucleoside phosphorylase domain-containing protein [Nemania abortiva]|nr:nucleoside phosphorylase domain-containing protein [Nemania abortiva]
MADNPRTYKDYTVGWICHSMIDFTEAIAMLDDRHPQLPNPRNNSYHLGSIGKHNIVIVCLFFDRLTPNNIGTIPTEIVVAQVAKTFPSIRFNLMVGTGSGIPPEVRLGDVVVGSPVGPTPGVIQWDLETKEKGNKFIQTSHLDRPPDLLRNAITAVRAEHALGRSRIQEYLDEMKANRPHSQPEYFKSDWLQDVLFEASYDHQMPEGEYEDEDEPCRYCDKAQVIQREPRSMLVHYGLIASSKRVVETAAFRDQLIEDVGEEVLCIETGAAEMVGEFNGLIIRGICDYADSHKNETWQLYAAALAAAYAKELLRNIAPRETVTE